MRHVAEIESSEAAEVLRLAVDAAAHGIIAIDGDGTIVLANAPMVQQFGYAQDELLGQPVEMLVPARLRTHRADDRTGCSVVPLAWSMGVGSDLFGLRKDGSEVPVEIGLNPIDTKEGRFVLAAIIDISERKRAEAMTQQSEARNGAILAAALDCIITMDRAGRIVEFNPAAERTFGHSRAAVLGKELADVIVPPSYRDSHRHGLARFLATGAATVFGRRLELTALHATGREFPVELTIAPIRLEDLQLFTGFLRDISERKRGEELKAQQLAALNLAEDAEEARQLAEQRKEALAQINRTLEREVAQRIRVAAELARSNAELEQFAYVASHDLQEPLRMVGSYLELLANRYRGQLDDKADRWIGFAVDAASRMKQLINDLLEFSRVNTHGKPLVATDCSRVLGTVIADLGEAIRESGAVVTHGPLPTVLADGGQLTQLFQNLIGNAIKYRGEAAPEIHVEAMRSAAGWQFSVRDNGIGIDPQFHERIFVIFQRLHTRAEYPGTGIGLALCRKIAERHAGRLWVASQLGQGATFSFTIPDRKDVADELEKPR